MTHDVQNFASKGTATAGLTTGIIGTALGLLGNTGNGDSVLGNLFGGNRNVHHGHDGFYHGGHNSYIIDTERRMAGMEAQLAALKVGEVKDAQIASLENQLAQAQMFRYVDEKTCGLVKGQTFINPNQMADPYMGQRMMIATYPQHPCPPFPYPPFPPFPPFPPVTPPVAEPSI